MPSANVVLGAGGPTGLQCLLRLLDVSDLPVRAVVRNPDKYKDVFPKNDKLEVVQGDVTDRNSLQACLKDARGVIFAAAGQGFWTPYHVDYKGVENVAAIAKEQGAERVVLVSSALVTPKNRWHPFRMFLNNVRWGLMDNKFRGEEALRASGVPYTIVRPGGLKDIPGGQADLIAEQGDKGLNGPYKSISRADVATVCVDALTNPAAVRVTLELISKPGASSPLSEQLKSLWANLKPDA